jgi:2-oxoglutarate ferredoxin oxidoreductase subunit beta
MQEAIDTKGFSFIEIMSQCPDNYGRRVGMRTANDFLHYFKGNSVPIGKASKMTDDELEGKIVIGKLHEKARPEYTTELHKITSEQVELLKKEQAS